MAEIKSITFFFLDKLCVDGKRCGETLFSLYTNAMNPSKVNVGLVEQNHPVYDTISCIDYYCDLQRKHDQKLSTSTNAAVSCPYVNQISIIQISSLFAKGPSYARALAQRKLLANEQFCMSIDSHSKLIKSWDDHVINEWKLINNELAVLSNQPAILWKKYNDTSIGQDEDLIMDSLIKEKQDGNFLVGHQRVYRNCIVLFNDYSVPVSHST